MVRCGPGIWTQELQHTLSHITLKSQQQWTIHQSIFPQNKKRLEGRDDVRCFLSNTQCLIHWVTERRELLRFHMFLVSLARNVQHLMSSQLGVLKQSLFISVSSGPSTVSTSYLIFSQKTETEWRVFSVVFMSMITLVLQLITKKMEWKTQMEMGLANWATCAQWTNTQSQSVIFLCTRKKIDVPPIIIFLPIFPSS